MIMISCDKGWSRRELHSISTISRPTRSSGYRMEAIYQSAVSILIVHAPTSRTVSEQLRSAIIGKISARSRQSSSGQRYHLRGKLNLHLITRVTSTLLVHRVDREVYFLQHCSISASLTVFYVVKDFQFLCRWCPSILCGHVHRHLPPHTPPPSISCYLTG